MINRKYLLLLLFFLLGLFPSTVFGSTTVCTDEYLKSCNVGDPKEGCLKECGVGLNKKENVDEYFFDSNTPSPDDCNNNILYFGSFGVDRSIGEQGEMVPVVRNYDANFISYCSKNSTIKATADGELVIYGIPTANPGYLRIKVNDSIKYTGILESFPIETTVNVSAGDAIQIIAASSATESSWGPGWRLLYSQDLYNNVNQAGDIPIVGQSWSDSKTDSNFDSYDFNDIKILPAIRKPPKCSDISVSLNTNDLDKIYLSEIAKLKVSVVIADQNLYYKKNLNTFDPNLTLGGNCDLSPNIDYNCQVISKANNANPTEVTWTNIYQVCRGNSCSDKCSINKTFKVFPFPGILRTQKGNVYIGKPSVNNDPQAVMNQSRYKSYYEKNSLLKFSTFNFAFNTNSITDHNPGETEILSEQKYILDDYNDSNHYENVYKRFASRIRSSHLINNILTYNSDTTFNDQDFINFGNNQIQLVDIVSGSKLTINGNIKCRSKTIFLVEGVLDITPNFEIEGDNACLFIVKGTTRVFQNSNLTNGLIRAFIISDGFTSIASDKKLVLDGGVVARSTKFDKNVNLNVIHMDNLLKDVASEDLTFEGARYIKHFGDILSNPFLLSIREKQYIK